MVDFDEYIDTKYVKYGDELYNVTNTLFDDLKINNALLTPKQLDKYIEKITRGKIYSYLTESHYGPSYLNNVTEKHLLTSEHVDTILSVITINNYYSVWAVTKYNIKKNKDKNDKFLWVSNLIKNKFVFTNDQISKLLQLNYDGAMNLILKKKVNTIEDLHTLCSYSLVTESDIKSICHKYNLVPDNKCFELLLNLTKDGTHYYSHNHVFTLDQIYSVLKATKFKFSEEMINLILKIHGRKINYLIVKELINNGIKLSADLIIPFIKSKADWTDIIKIFKDMFENGIKFTATHYMEIIGVTDELIDNDNKTNKTNNEDSEDDNSEEYKSQKIPIKLNKKSKNNVLLEVHDFFIKTVKIEITPEICDYVCEKQDNLLLQYLIKNNLFQLTDNSLNLACKKLNKYAIQEIVNMKVIATKDNIRLIDVGKIISADIVNLLLLSGLVVDYETVELLHNRNYTFEDLTTFGLEYADDLYYSIHKSSKATEDFMSKVKGKRIIKAKKTKKGESLFNIVYLTKMDQRVIKFRLMFIHYTLDEIKKYIEDENLIPDQFCYDNSVCNEDKTILDWLTKDYNLYPTFLTLMRCDDFNIRNTLYNKYFDKLTLADIKSLYVKPKIIKKVEDTNNNIANDVVENVQNTEKTKKKTIPKKTETKKTEAKKPQAKKTEADKPQAKKPEADKKIKIGAKKTNPQLVDY